MKRVAVLGSPGAGKSTFCRKLVEKTGLPIFHIDRYFMQDPDYYTAHKQEWAKLVLDIINKDEWIIDGNYSSTFNERFERADLIVLLDVPRRTAFKGIFQRRIQYHNKKRPDMPDAWDEKLNWNFIKFVWDFHSDKKQNIKEAIAKFPQKETHIFKTRKQADKFLANL